MAKESKRTCVYEMNDFLAKIYISDIYVDKNGVKRVVGKDVKGIVRDVPLERCYWPYQNLFGEGFMLNYKGELKDL